MNESRLLWILSALFLLRVIGQLLVELFGVRFLPPSPEWFSGLLPYPALLFSQIVILMAMVTINLGVSRTGTFRSRSGRSLYIFSILYAAVMVVRYFVSGQLHPERRFWPPGSIPIVFHFVLAAYIYVLSRLARRATIPPAFPQVP